MKRRNFIRVSFAAVCAVALKVSAAGRRLLYPGRVVPLNQESLKNPAKWLG